jgi:ankyrin repeat protein
MGKSHARITAPFALGMQGMTALHMAAHQGFSAIVNHIASALANRDDINLPDKLGRTALHYAAALGHGETVDSLWKMKGSLDAADNQGWTGAKAFDLSVG